MPSGQRSSASAARIRVLPQDVVSKIAAGEVVERPASVVKELVENSLDAGATRIDVEVRGAPHVFLSVEDNGCGMSTEEAGLALERHSTSKISCEDDLSKVTTLGFRGEALPSIAAVSRLELWTQTEGEPEGVHLRFAGGEEPREERISMPPGTRIEVRDLFYNVPVRRKFLRSVDTELRHVIRFVEACALAHRRVFFRLFRDGEPSLSVPPSDDLRDRVSSVHGHQLAAGLIAARGSAGGVKVEALVGKPEATRAARESMVFLVNGRWISSPVLVKAVRDAYGDLLPTGRFPTAFVLIEVEPALVDSNVHPAKREVRFSPKARVYDAVRDAVAGELSEHAPELWPSGEGEPARDRIPVPPRQERLGLGAHGRTFEGPSSGDRSGYYADRPPQARGVMELYRGEEPRVGGEGEAEVVNLWQLHGSYICGQTRSGLVIVDQHAAHERILYEAALTAMRQNSGSSQQLLFPQVMDLSAGDYDTLLEMLPQLEKLGFDIRSLSRRSIAVYGIPADARDWRDGGLLRDIIDEYASAERTERESFEAVAKSYACHAAIKAGQPQSPQEMNALMDQLFATEVPQGDPHGRPTYLQISLKELEKRFGRS